MLTNSKKLYEFPFITSYEMLTIMHEVHAFNQINSIVRSTNRTKNRQLTNWSLGLIQPRYEKHSKIIELK